jgi:tetratricopeptide (TPR) repeat protein
MKYALPAIFAAAAMSAFCSCVRRGPTVEELKAYGEAKASYAAGRLAEAEAELLPLSHDSTLPQARFLLGKTRYFLGRHEEAAAIFEDLGDRFPKYHEADIWLARVRLQQGKIDESEKIARELLSNDSCDSRLYYLEAMIRVAQGDLKEALGFLERSAESGEELAKSYFESARLYYRFGQDDRAMERLRRADALLSTAGPMREAVDELLKRVGNGAVK